MLTRQLALMVARTATDRQTMYRDPATRNELLSQYKKPDTPAYKNRNPNFLVFAIILGMFFCQNIY
jgi:hypothetical protein